VADWSFVLCGTPPSGLAFLELTGATARRAVWRVDDSPTVAFGLDGRSAEAAAIVELATDLIVYRDGAKLFRGRLGAIGDRINADLHRCSLAAIGYRGMLDTRIIAAGGESFTGVDQGTIAWNLIQTTQAQSGGNWGITNGIGATLGTARDRSYDPGKPRGEAISELGRVDGGFEWEIDADLALNRWSPTRGSATGVVLDWGGLISSVDRQLSPRDYSNAPMAIGADGLTPAVQTSATIATDPQGRWELSRGYTTILEQATLDARALWLLDQTSTLRPEFAATFRAGAWGGPSHVWIGDTVTLVVNSGRLAVNAAHRVVELAADLDDNGGETITVGLVAA
jgi:hypothetical protein